MPKDNLKDKLEGNELDLSLSNLSVVPVKELVSEMKETKKILQPYTKLQTSCFGFVTFDN